MDAAVQILQEVTNHPEDFIRSVMQVCRDLCKGQHRFNEELSDKEYSILLDGLREEKAGILSWFDEGVRRWESRLTN